MITKWLQNLQIVNIASQIIVAGSGFRQRLFQGLDILKILQQNVSVIESVKALSNRLQKRTLNIN